MVGKLKKTSLLLALVVFGSAQGFFDGCKELAQIEAVKLLLARQEDQHRGPGLLVGLVLHAVIGQSILDKTFKTQDEIIALKDKSYLWKRAVAGAVFLAGGNLWINTIKLGHADYKTASAGLAMCYLGGCVGEAGVKSLAILDKFDKEDKTTWWRAPVGFTTFSAGVLAAMCPIALGALTTICA